VAGDWVMQSDGLAESVAIHVIFKLLMQPMHAMHLCSRGDSCV
jgi:hypothetical protein